MYTKGSSALKTEYYTYDESPKKRSAKIKRMPIRKKGTKPAAVNSSRLIKKRIIVAMALIFSMAFVILQRYAAITEENDKLNKSRAELELVNAKVVEAQMYAKGDLDPKTIDQQAERLGLRPPTKEQIKYVSLGNTDNGEVLKVEETGSSNAFINALSGILEYLY